MNFYNEIDPYCAQWLRNLIEAGEIPVGLVDERSIEDIAPTELSGFIQCHFFAGLGGWALALREAGISADYPLWTGSCPCQPFSAAGKGGGFADERHLWPAFDWLIGQCRPDLVLGEQVEGSAGRTWLDLVATDMEGHGYAFGTAVFPAAGVGAPHIRHRTYWVADSSNAGRLGRGSGEASIAGEPSRLEPERLRAAGRLADADRPGCGRQRSAGLSGDGDASFWYDLDGRGKARGLSAADGGCSMADYGTTASPVNSFWSDADWIFCRDGKWRPIEPGSFPLASGAPARVGRLRAYGNAICVPQAQAFIEAVMNA